MDKIKILAPKITETSRARIITFEFLTSLNTIICVDKCFLETANHERFEFVSKYESYDTKDRKKLELIHNISDKISFMNSYIYLSFTDIVYRTEYSYMYKYDISRIWKMKKSETKDVDENRLKELKDNIGVEDTEEKFFNLKSDDIIINRYIGALKEESYFLSNNGGKKYELFSGKMVHKLPDYYAYYFETQDEIYLPESTKGELILSGQKKVSCNVISCEDTQIMLSLTSYVGDDINGAELLVKPWEIPRKLAYKLSEYKRKDNTICASLLHEGLLLVDSNRPLSDLKFGQDEAVKSSLNNQVTLIWGPPGTGKTHTMASIIAEAYHSKKKILVVSHSNISVDGVINKLYERKNELGLHDAFKNGQILRYGYPRNKDLLSRREALSYTYTFDSETELKATFESYTKEVDGLNKKKQVNSVEYKKAEKKLKEIKAIIKDKEKQNVLNASVVATTITKVFMDSLFDDRFYDYVLFDEVSMANMPQIIYAAMKTYKHLVLVGDFCQLSPIVQSDRKKDLGTDVFRYLGIAGSDNRINYHPWLVMLNVQRRMYPKIAKFSNKEIYKGLLKSDKENQNENIVNIAPFKGSSMVFVDIKGINAPIAKDKNHSHFNIVSAMVSVRIAMSVKSPKVSIGIIAPYVAQVRLIRSLINLMRPKAKVTCATIHQFQGSERDIIILDIVENFPANKLGILLTEGDSNNVTRLINVAITRAKGKFIAVGDSRFWKNQTNHIFEKLRKHILQEGTIVDYKTFNAYKNEKVIITFSDYENQFFDDIENAKKKIVISLPAPFNELGESKKILRLLDKTRSNCVEIIVKTRCFNELSDDWKEITRETENAIFPLIVIDDEIVWYGVPALKSKFSLKNGYSFENRENFIFRVKNSRFASLVIKFTDLETNDSGSKLSEKYQKYGEKNISRDFKAYIMDNIKCKKCGAYMGMARGKRAPYLKCSNLKCGNNEWLTVDLVDNYIFEYNIKCPECGGALKAKLGSYGVYVQCNNYEERHFIKVENL